MELLQHERNYSSNYCILINLIILVSYDYICDCYVLDYYILIIGLNSLLKLYLWISLVMIDDYRAKRLYGLIIAVIMPV